MPFSIMLYQGAAVSRGENQMPSVVPFYLPHSLHIYPSRRALALALISVRMTPLSFHQSCLPFII